MVELERLKELTYQDGSLIFSIEMNGETRIIIDEESGEILVYKDNEMKPEARFTESGRQL
jgi:rRNA processing protein Krr1/Pno1